MNLRNDFIANIKHLNGQKVTLTIVQVTPETHPLGLLGYMMMGAEHTERIAKAKEEYNGDKGVIVIEAVMELIKSEEGYNLLFIADNYECNCIEIFRPTPPMIMEGVDMSLWWSYHPLSHPSLSKLKLLKDKYSYSCSTKSGDCYPIREIFVNNIRHGR